jgi:hypothetical protein
MPKKDKNSKKPANFTLYYFSKGRHKYFNFNTNYFRWLFCLFASAVIVISIAGAKFYITYLNNENLSKILSWTKSQNEKYQKFVESIEKQENSYKKIEIISDSCGQTNLYKLKSQFSTYLRSCVQKIDRENNTLNIRVSFESSDKTNNISDVKSLLGIKRDKRLRYHYSTGIRALDSDQNKLIYNFSFDLKKNRGYLLDKLWIAIKVSESEENLISLSNALKNYKL